MMGNCPHCGAELEARLVAAIRDPDRSESCPRKGVPPAEPMPDISIENLGVYMLAAAFIRQGLAA